MISAICKEILLRKNEVNESVETLYFGGGTPSLLEEEELKHIFKLLYENFDIIQNPEVTLEANPDDLDKSKIKLLKFTPINRLSIGIQSFYDLDLKFMNRAHNSGQAETSVKTAQDAGFDNITIDLIYGGQTTTDEMWESNLEKALALGVPHISSYALTIEPKTALNHWVKTLKINDLDEEKQARQFEMLVNTLTQNGFLHYEISNFGKPNFLSQHNSAYWKGIPYLGLGPSAHSFDGKNRSWNPANNTVYLKQINKGILPLETERLSENERFNEMLMIRLRTMEGLSIEEVKKNFPNEFTNRLLSEIQTYTENNMLCLENNHIRLTQKGLFFADGIAASLFRI